MSQISGAVVAIAVVLMAVFIPSAMQSGSVGAIYRQFALTIALSTAFSAFLALVFTPALCATIIKPAHVDENELRLPPLQPRCSTGRATPTPATSAARSATCRCGWASFAVVLDRCAPSCSASLPTSFVPEEDQGYALAIVSLPPGRDASSARTRSWIRSSTIIAQEPRSRGRVRDQRLQFRRQRRKRRHGVHRASSHGTSASTRAPQLIQQFQGQLFGGIKDAHGVRRQPADDPRPRPVRRLRSVSAGSRRRRATTRWSMRRTSCSARPPTRRTRWPACARTAWRTRRSWR